MWTRAGKGRKPGCPDLTAIFDVTAGAHSVIIVGYGEESGVKYWRVQNSWGADWGDDGYIKMKRGGANNCKLETWASASLPKIEGFAYKNGKAFSSGSLVGLSFPAAVLSVIALVL